MNGKRILVGLVLADFLGFTAYVLYTYGLVGWVPMAVANPVTTLVTVDLVLALSIAMGWTWRDARARGVNPVPYLVVTALTGSAGLLWYLFDRLRTEPVAGATVGTQDRCAAAAP